MAWFVMLVALTTCGRPALDNPPARADAIAVQRVAAFEEKLRAWPKGQEKERDAAVRDFFKNLPDRDSKLAAIAITDSRFVYPIPRDLVSELMGRFLQDRDLEVRLRAARSLGYNQKAGDHVDALIALLKEVQDKDPSHVIHAMGRARDERFLASLKELLKHQESKVRVQAVFALRNYPRVEVMDHVMALWNDPDQQVRHDLLAFADPATKSGTALLIERLRDPSAHVRTQAVAYLGRSQAADVPKIVAGMLKDSHPYVRGKALAALAELKATSYLDTIAARLADLEEDVYVRRMAILALEQLGERRYLPQVRNRLRDSDNQIRDHAVRIAAAWEKSETARD